MQLRWLVPIVGLLGCGSSSEPADVPEVAADTAADTASEAASDALADSPVEALRRCATTGKGAIAGDACFLLTPVESGLPASGVNANVDQYALRPTTGARGKLVVFFNGSGGSPAAGTRGSPTDNFYATARSTGLHVFAVSYRSDEAVGVLCKGNDACFLPTRRTILTGVYEAGAHASLSGIAVHEGARARLIAALKTLAARDPSGGWGVFLDGDEVRWSSIVAAGHSQGGGHAAVIGKVFAIDRVVALSSPCDQTASGPASWLDASKSTYATSPATAFHGLGAAGDTICPGYAANWDALGLDASRRHADATICAGAAAHGATIDCVENAPLWKKMLE